MRAGAAANRLCQTLNNQELSLITDNTITEVVAPIADLADILKRGFVVDRAEKNLGMRCIPASVFDVNAEAIVKDTICGPTRRMTLKDIERLRA